MLAGGGAARRGISRIGRFGESEPSAPSREPTSERRPAKRPFPAGGRPPRPEGARPAHSAVTAIRATAIGAARSARLLIRSARSGAGRSRAVGSCGGRSCDGDGRAPVAAGRGPGGRSERRLLPRRDSPASSSSSSTSRGRPSSSSTKSKECERGDFGLLAARLADDLVVYADR